MNKLKEYTVFIGEDHFTVQAVGNQEAAYKAARLFKEKYNLTYSLSDITYYASTKLTPAFTTAEVLNKLRKVL